MHLRLPRGPSDALARCSVDPDLAALQKILADLRHNLELAFNGEFEGDSSEEILRSRYVFALATIGNFLKATTASENLSKRFFELAIALNDLNYGRVEAFLRPSRATSASTRLTWCKRAKVAVAVHAYRYCADRLTREQAAKKVAEDFPRINELAAFDRDRVNPSPPELKALNWYDEFGKPNSKLPSVARSIFELGQQLMNFPDVSSEILRPRIREYLETIGDVRK
jgi:hypothetical protein